MARADPPAGRPELRAVDLPGAGRCPGGAGVEFLPEDIQGMMNRDSTTLRWRRNGQTKLKIKLESEDQRIDALRSYFGIHLDEADRDAIKGTVSEIVSGGSGSAIG
ncbi:hypothetical protein F4809DRAFT_637293 [Biscogniauxia mediterranea]|nr:hypothetical protein F4809DRAFT_637293 [Biscogniauxia mediterranea]